MDQTQSLIAKFNTYPLKRDYEFHCGIIRLPFWVEEDGIKPFRPQIAICACPQTMALNASDPVDRPPFESMLESLAGVSKISMIKRYRPSRIIVTDPELGQYLRQALRDSAVEIEVVESDPLLEEFARGLTGGMGPIKGGPKIPPGALSGQGVTPERMLAFADAARRFYLAAPWRHLTSDDLIVIESPKAPNGLACATVLGNGEQVYGLGFFKSRQQFDQVYNAPDDLTAMEKQGKMWSMLFGPIDHMPTADADLFEEHGLPIAADDAYPYLTAADVKSRQVTRPDAATLCFVEGLMRMLADTTEDEMDTGRWSKTVQTAEGPVQYTLSLPQLLEEAPPAPNPANPLFMQSALQSMMRRIESSGLTDIDEINEFLEREVVGGKADALAPPTNPLEQAQELVLQAFDAQGRKQVQLARKAIALCPECADAYTLLAERENDPQREHELYEKAVEAGRKSLGELFFKKHVGQFWGIVESRPYMRARLGLANSLRREGKLHEAADHYRELLRLNPGDNQGVRELLVTILYELDAFDELKKLLARYDDDTAHWLYMEALFLFRTEGDSDAAREAATEALIANKMAQDYILADDDVADELPASYALGSEEEAILVGENQWELWENTPGAVEWLELQKLPQRTKPKSKKTSGKGKKKRK